MTYDPEEESIRMDRHPIIFGNETVAIINMIHGTSKLADSWTWSLVDPRNVHRDAAQELIKQISPYCSIDFLWCLREEVAKEIERHNTNFETKFTIDRPKDE